MSVNILLFLSGWGRSPPHLLLVSSSSPHRLLIVSSSSPHRLLLVSFLKPPWSFSFYVSLYRLHVWSNAPQRSTWNGARARLRACTAQSVHVLRACTAHPSLFLPCFIHEHCGLSPFMLFLLFPDFSAHLSPSSPSKKHRHQLEERDTHNHTNKNTQLRYTTKTTQPRPHNQDQPRLHNQDQPRPHNQDHTTKTNQDHTTKITQPRKQRRRSFLQTWLLQI